MRGDLSRGPSIANWCIGNIHLSPDTENYEDNDNDTDNDTKDIHNHNHNAAGKWI